MAETTPADDEAFLKPLRNAPWLKVAATPAEAHAVHGQTSSTSSYVAAISLCRS